jgi:hypothetical protein
VAIWGRALFAAGAFLATACGAHSTSSIIGNRDDAKTREGAYPGYHVTHACSQRDCFGLEGDGAHWYPGMEREHLDDDTRFRAAFEQYRAAALAVTGDISIQSTALGQGCKDFGLVVGVSDWHVIDPLIAKLGDFLRGNDLREEITLCVEGPMELTGGDDAR